MNEKNTNDKTYEVQPPPARTELRSPAALPADTVEVPTDAKESTTPTPSAAPRHRHDDNIKMPITAYLMAFFSFLFVAIGSFFAISVLPAVTQKLGFGVSSVVHGLFIASPIVALSLGLLSGYQSFRLAKTKEINKRSKIIAERKFVCPSCGDANDGKAKFCPMCGHELTT